MTARLANPSRRRSADTTDDAADLLAAGESPARICVRLGLTAAAIARAAHRAGRPDIGNQFERLRTRAYRPTSARRYLQNRTAA